MNNATSSTFTQSPLVLAIVFIANGLAYSFFVITLPIVGRQLDFSDKNTAIILSSSALIITLVSPLWGKICERWGRRRVVVLSIAATTLFTIMSANIIQLRVELALSGQLAFFLLLSARILNSLFTGGMKPAGQAYIADITHNNGRAKGMGLMGASFGIGSLLGGMCAMLSGSDNLLLGYTLVSVVLMISYLIAQLTLPDSRNIAEQPSNPITSPIPYSKIWVFLLITLGGLALFSLLQHVISLTMADKFQLSADSAVKTSGLCMMVMMAAMIITQGVLLRALSLPPLKLVLLGSTCVTLSLISASQVPTLWVFIAVISLFGIGIGLLLPGNLALLSTSVDQYSQGRIAGINGIAQGIGLALGPLAGSLLHNTSHNLPYLIGILFLLIPISCLIIVNQRQ